MNKMWFPLSALSRREDLAPVETAASPASAIPIEAPLNPPPAAKPTPLYCTWTLITGMTGIFVAEAVFAFGKLGHDFAPSLRSLIFFGALNRELLALPGGWTRLFSSTLLHADDTHLLYNMIALYLTGRVLERMVGGAWFFSLYFLCGFCGSLASGFLGDPHSVSVGASGAIMGLMGAALVVAFKLPSGIYRSRILRGIGPGFVMSLFPQVFSAGKHVDLSAHLGGAVCGVVLAGLLSGTWNKQEPLPLWESIGKLAAFSGIFIFLWSAAVPAYAYGHNRDLAAQMAPPDSLPKPFAKAVAQSKALVEQYPNDPHVLFCRAVAYWQAGNLAGGERALRKALGEGEILDLFYGKSFKTDLQLDLAEILLQQGRRTEAKETAKSLCEGRPEDDVAAKLKKLKL